MLSDLQKYRIYGTYPWKIIVHLALVIFCSIWALSINEIDRSVKDSQKVAFHFLFLNDDPKEYNEIEGYSREKVLFNI